MTRSNKIVLAFDVYGTLLDTGKVQEQLVSKLHLDSHQAVDVGLLWRRYQLEYTWRLNSMNKYGSFDVVTKKALIHALSDFGCNFSEDDVAQLMTSYHSLECFPDAKTLLHELKQFEEVEVVAFSNGTDVMVRSALRAASIETLLSAVYVADSVQKYKPSPEIYNWLVESVGKSGAAQDVFLISGNPFDITGALAAGMRAIWVDRAKKGWVDQLSGQSPTISVDGLGKVKLYVESMTTGK